MKQIACDYLGCEVKDAVITVPAYFNNNQKQATKDAASGAGLNVLGLISEPTAAAIAYGMNNKIIMKSNVVIYDLGGGTFDVSVLTMEDGDIVVKSTSGDTHLGGNEFDTKLVNYFAERIKRLHKIDVSKDKLMLNRLRGKCETAKCSLSFKLMADLGIDCLLGGKDWKDQISRAQFEEMNEEYFESTMNHVDKALKDAGMGRKEVTQIVIVGGSTRIPRIQELLGEFFDRKELDQRINPDEAIAYGAAVKSAILSNTKSDVISNILIKDLVPLSLGVCADGGLMSVIIERNTQIPVSKMRNYVTANDNQSGMDIEIYEGERADISKNTRLDTFELSGIPREPRGSIGAEVTFSVDVNGILTVSAVCKKNGVSKKLTVSDYQGRLSTADIDAMIFLGQQFQADDEKYKKRVTAMNELENYAYKMKYKMEERNVRNKVSVSDRQNITQQCTKVISWIGDNRTAGIEEYKRREEELKSICLPIISKL